MKKIVLLVCCLPFILIAGDLKSALVKGRSTNKPVMVVVKSESCAYCDKMKTETLNTQLVRNNTQEFIKVTVDKGSPDADRYLPDTRYTPTVYFISPKLKIVNTVSGYLGRDDFNLWVDDTKRKLGIKSSKKVYKEVAKTQSKHWMYDIASAMDYASQTGKQLMIYVDADGSKWTTKMKQTTFANAQVQKALKNFVWVRIKKGDAQARSFGLQPKYAPTVYFMRANMKQLAKAEGYFEPSDFILWINHAKSKI